MKQLKNFTAIKAWLALMLFCVASMSWAGQVVGTIVQLNGPMMARKADGAVRVLSMKSEVESGDLLLTEKTTYAMVKFIDNSEITLKPSTTFKVDNFSYDADKPDGDNASFSLVKGGLRSVTGLLGKRNKEKFSMKTPSATIGIRGTTYIAEIVEAMRAGPVKPGTRAPGLYLEVIDGMVVLRNEAGSVVLSAGQFAMAPLVTPPPASSVGPPVRREPATKSEPQPGLVPVAPPAAPAPVASPMGSAPVAPAMALAPVVPPTSLPPVIPETEPAPIPAPIPVSAPVIVPTNPGMEFVPPPSFNIPVAAFGTTAPPKTNAAVDCQVR